MHCDSIRLEIVGCVRGDYTNLTNGTVYYLKVAVKYTDVNIYAGMIGFKYLDEDGEFSVVRIILYMYTV